MNETIVLTRDEQEFCRSIGYHRNNNKKLSGIVSIKRDPTRTDLQIHVEGFGGEFAFCKMFNLKPDLKIENTSVNKRTDNGDTNLENGDRVDVKTKRSIGWLEILKRKIPVNVEWFALMVGEMPTYTFKGMIKKSDLINSGRCSDKYGNGMIYYAKEEHLVDFPRTIKIHVHEWM